MRKVRGTRGDREKQRNEWGGSVVSKRHDEGRIKTKTTWRKREVRERPRRERKTTDHPKDDDGESSRKNETKKRKKEKNKIKASN